MIFYISAINKTSKLIGSVFCFLWFKERGSEGVRTWWRHQMETFSALLAFCAGNSPVPVNSPRKGQWRGALMFSLICARINGWVNNGEAGDLRRYHAHYDVTVMSYQFYLWWHWMSLEYENNDITQCTDCFTEDLSFTLKITGNLHLFPYCDFKVKSPFQLQFSVTWQA